MITNLNKFKNYKKNTITENFNSDCTDSTSINWEELEKDFMQFTTTYSNDDYPVMRQTFNYLKEKITSTNESITESVSDKDWARMITLVLQDSSGEPQSEKVARSIKDKNKAIARFVAALKLSDATEVKTKTNYRDEIELKSSNPFVEFGERAIELGATIDEIINEFDVAVIPAKYSDQLAGSTGKKLNNGFVSFISKLFLDNGFDIKYTYSGNAITGNGREVMSNGRKWTIGYKATVTKDGTDYDFAFDAVTDEGGGTCYYAFSRQYSNQIFRNYFNNSITGKLKFAQMLKQSIDKILDPTIISDDED